MGVFSGFKATKAMKMQKAGNKEEAIRLYEESFAEGMNQPRFLLAYALLLIRDGQYQKAKDFLVKNQKAPGMTQQQRIELLVDYACCCFKLGSLDKGINTLEQQFRKTETGLIYQTLGYLYVEKYVPQNKPDFAALAAEAAAETEAVKEEAGEEPETAAEGNPDAEAGEGGEEPAAKKLTPEEEWNAGIDRAEKFIRDSVEYDDADPVCLDNLGQFLFRVREDKAAAKEWFEKALEVKDSQIDTLYFLSRYDLDKGDKEAAAEKLEKALKGRFSPLNYCDQEMLRKELAQLKGAAEQ